METLAVLLADEISIIVNGNGERWIHDKSQEQDLLPWLNINEEHRKGWELVMKIIIGGCGIVTLRMDCQMRQKIDNSILEKINALKVDQVRVQGNIQRFDLLDENVKLAEGYLFYSLPKVQNQVETLAILPADEDM